MDYYLAQSENLNQKLFELNMNFLGKSIESEKKKSPFYIKPNCTERSKGVRWINHEE